MADAEHTTDQQDVTERRNGTTQSIPQNFDIFPILNLVRDCDVLCVQLALISFNYVSVVRRLIDSRSNAARRWQFVRSHCVRLGRRMLWMLFENFFCMQFMEKTKTQKPNLTNAKHSAQNCISINRMWLSVCVSVALLNCTNGGADAGPGPSVTIRRNFKLFFPSSTNRIRK